MDNNDLEKLKVAFNEFAKQHPTPDAHLVSYGSKMLSARKIAQEVEAETDTGKFFIRMVEASMGALGETIDQVVARFKRIQPKP